MKYSGVATVSTFQVGDTVYTIENDEPRSDTVEATKSVIKKVGESVVETITYKLSKQTTYIPANEVFASASAIKSDFESKVDGL